MVFPSNELHVKRFLFSPFPAEQHLARAKLRPAIDEQVQQQWLSQLNLEDPRGLQDKTCILSIG